MSQYPPPPAPGHGPQQQYPGQWDGYTPPPVKKPAPVTALSRLGAILVLLLVIAGLLEGFAWLLPRLVEDAGGMLLAVLLSLVYVVILLASLGVAVACVIVGIIAFARLPSGKVRNAALLIVIAALVGSGAVATGTSGDSVPHAIWIVVTAIRWLGGLVAIVLGIVGLVRLRRSTDLRM